MDASKATTAKTNLETQQMPAELRVKQQTANAASQTAGTGASRLNFDINNPVMQHAKDQNDNPLTFNTRTGAYTPAMGANGVALPSQGKLTEKAKNEISGLQAEYGTVGQAIELAKKNPDEFGVPRGAATEAGPMAESLVGRMYSDQENQARAAVFNTISSVIKERAGTAQSKQELTRINSFMPGSYDSIEQIESKFRGYQEYLKERAQGFAQPVVAGQGILADKPQAAQGKAPADAVRYLIGHPEFADQFKQKYGYLPDGK